MTPDLVIIGCVAQKLDRPAPARELYTSALWKGRRSYAEASGLPWYVFSARWGLVTPDQVLEPYDRTFTGEWAGEWRTRLSATAAGVIIGAGYRRIELHMGVAYHLLLSGMLERLGAQVLLPLKGLEIGEQLAWYSAQARERRLVAGGMRA